MDEPLSFLSPIYTKSMDFLQSMVLPFPTKEIKEPTTLWDELKGSAERTLDILLPYAFILYWYIFFILLITATVGRKLKLRNLYIEVLDKLFSVAAVEMEEQTTRDKIRRRKSFLSQYEEESEVEECLTKRDKSKKGNPQIFQNSKSETEKGDFKICSQPKTDQNYYSASPVSQSLESSWEELNMAAENESTLNKTLINNVVKNNHSDESDVGTNNDINSVSNTNVPLVTEPYDKINIGVESVDAAKLNIDFKEECKDNEATKCTAVESTCSTHQTTNDTTPTMTCSDSKDMPSRSSEDNLDGKESSLGVEEISRLPLDAPMVYISAGMRAIQDDCVSNSFSPEQLKTWNLLSRTILHKKRIGRSPSLTVFFLVGLVIRYMFLMPMRVLVLCLSLGNLALCTCLVGGLPDGSFKRTINSYVVSWGFDFVAGSLSVVARFHNKENRPDHGIAVANHTSPIDGMVLATDNCYDMVGQKTAGLLGMFMNSLAKSSGHIWFDRSETRDRQAITRLLTQHTKDTSLPPILIFPEGVCVNNTAVLEFRKGAFEVECDIFPIAVRFDPVYGDAFWSEGGFAAYCFSMMTSWAIVCDVFYLPPVRKFPDESASEFASRVRSSIARAGGMLELQWSSSVKGSQCNADKWTKLKLERQEEEQQQFVRQLSLDEDSSSSSNEKDSSS